MDITDIKEEQILKEKPEPDKKVPETPQDVVSDSKEELHDLSGFKSM